MGSQFIEMELSMKCLFPRVILHLQRYRIFRIYLNKIVFPVSKSLPVAKCMQHSELVGVRDRSEVVG